jgi:tripartite-type tricarboxylate transporter receptor subunit TctC
MIQNRRKLITAMIAAAASALPSFTHAAAYPDRPIELVVPFQAGGGTDAVARAFAKASQKHFPKGVIVLNKAGASGSIGWQHMINAKADGYTLAVVTVEMVILPHLNLFNRTYEDVTPIAQLNADPASLVVRSDSPVNTVEELIAAARKDAGKMSMGTSGNGTIYDLAAAAFEDKAGVKFNRVPYQGAAPAILSLLGGQLDAVTASPAEVSAHVAAGKLKVLAVMADKRLDEFKSVPTLKERNIALSIGTWRGIMGPKNLPAEVVSTLKTAVAAIAGEPELQATLKQLNLGYVYADDIGFKSVMARDNQVFKELVTKLKITP